MKILTVFVCLVFLHQADDELLLQFDPLAESTGFLDDIDGYAYFFFGEGKYHIDDIRFFIDRS